MKPVCYGNENPRDLAAVKIGPKEECTEDSYKWLKKVGEGSFGLVYKVKDIETKEIYAIKTIYQGPDSLPKEFLISEKLNHPNTIKIYKHFSSKTDEDPTINYLNLVMDYFPDNLYRICRYYPKNGIKFPEALGRIYSWQLFRALAYTHALGICHRDVKPQNILVDTSNHKIVLCDFGSAKKINPSE